MVDACGDGIGRVGRVSTPPYILLPITMRTRDFKVSEGREAAIPTSTSGALHRSEYAYATPANDLAKAFAAWFPHGWDFIAAPLPPPGQKPSYRTETRYPLTGAQLWARWQDPADLIGVSFGQLTQYGLVDLDITGPYADAWEPVIYALEEKAGLCGFVPTQSSHSGGKHLFFPLPEPVSTWELALVMRWACETSGLTVQDGQLETFPNVKQWNSRYKAHALPLQPGRGSVLLNKAGEPVSQLPSDWLRAMAQEAEQQDMKRFRAAVKKAKQWWQCRKRQRDRHSQTTFNAFRDDLAWEMEQGWTGEAQSNRLIYRALQYGYIFLRHTGEALVKWAIATIPTLPGFDRWCQTKGQALEKWIRQKVKVVEEKYFVPEFGGTAKPQQPSQNDVLREAKRSAIQAAMTHIERAGETFDTITALQERITELSGVSKPTCYKHRDLWHPEHRSVLTAPADEGLRAPEAVAEGGVEEECDRPETSDNQGLLIPQSLLKGMPEEDSSGEKSSSGSERSAPPFQLVATGTSVDGQLRDLASLRRELHRLRSQYAAASCLGDPARAASAQRAVEQLGFDARVVFQPDFNVFAIG